MNVNSIRLMEWRYSNISNLDFIRQIDDIGDSVGDIFGI